jgi:hypothetical protein
MTVVRNIIIFISISFGVMLIINFGAVTIINVQKLIQEKLLLEIEIFADVEEEAKKIDAKTVAYKKFANERQLILPKTQFVLDNIGSGIRLNSVDITSSNFALNLVSKTPLDITKLITEYLEGGIVSEIVIESASFDKSKEEFRVGLRGTFK